MFFGVLAGSCWLQVFGRSSKIYDIPTFLFHRGLLEKLIASYCIREGAQLQVQEPWSVNGMIHALILTL